MYLLVPVGTESLDLFIGALDDVAIDAWLPLTWDPPTLLLWPREGEFCNDDVVPLVTLETTKLGWVWSLLSGEGEEGADWLLASETFEDAVRVIRVDLSRKEKLLYSESKYTYMYTYV